MPDLEILEDEETGSVTLIVRGAPMDERRFRLKETLTNKYLGKRGWSKAPVYLPEDAVEENGALKLVLGPQIADRIAKFATLVLEAPSAGFSRDIVWRPVPLKHNPAASGAVEKVPVTVEPDATEPVLSEEASPAIEADVAAEPETGNETAPRQVDDEIVSAEDIAPLLEKRSNRSPLFFAIAAVALIAGAMLAMAAPDFFGLVRKARVEALVAENAQLKKSLEGLPSSSAKAAEHELEKAKNQLAESRTTIDTLNKQIATLQKSKPGTQGELPADERILRAEEERDLYRQELERITANFQTLQKEKTALETNPGLNPTRAFWGAASIDEQGTIYALQNQTMEGAAKDYVNAICQGKSRFKCTPLVTYRQSCISVARVTDEPPTPSNFGYAVNADWKAAEAQAIAQCEKRGGSCSVRFTSCSPDTISKPAAN